MPQLTKNNALYFPELDGLRFFAFLVVFFHHAPVLSVPVRFIADFMLKLHQYGWMGVDLFLCLSAFLFARLLFAEFQAAGDINIKNFYIRRSLRIWPLYYIFCIVMLLITINRKHGWTLLIAQRIFGLATFTDNVWAAVFTSYNILWASAHLWTISYEEQFYAIIPWSLRRIFRLAQNQKILVVLAIFVLFSGFRAVLVYWHTPHPVIWVLPFTHFESILGGLVVGLGLLDQPLKRISPWILFLAGLASLVWVTFLPNVQSIGWNLMLTYPLVGIGMALVLFSFTQAGIWGPKRLLQTRWLTYLGKISYGLYVFHVMGILYAERIAAFLQISEERVILYPLTVAALGFSITVLVAAISYQWLEKPFLRLKKRFTTIQSRPV